MQKNKKIISLVLAAFLSLSLFACKDDGSLNPVDESKITQEVDGNQLYDVLKERITPKLSYDKEEDFEDWTKEVREKFIELFGLDNIKQNACPLDVKIDSTEQIEETEFMPAHTRIHFLFNSEYGCTVPAYLLVPDTGKTSYPLAITLQGHAEGGYLNSVGITDSTDPEAYANDRGAFAIQALENGYIALAIEQRGMASQKPDATHQQGGNTCDFNAHRSLLLGRTILGERIWDVSKAIDALSSSVIKAAVPSINLKDITITGNSGGGTASFYAACYDERITLCAPSCGFASYSSSLLYAYHCSCNFVPNAYEWFDMPDLACLIAPRKLAIVGGVADKIFPYDGVQIPFDDVVKKIYAKAGKPNNCSVTITGYGHYWSETDVWSAIASLRG